MQQHILAMFGLPGGVETIVIVLVALLLFGRRLPDVARSIGKSIVEFKRGMRDVKDELNDTAKLDTKLDTKLESTPPPKLDNKSDTPADHSAGE